MRYKLNLQLGVRCLTNLLRAAVLVALAVFVSPPPATVLAVAVVAQQTVSSQHGDATVTLSLSNDVVQVATPFDLVVEVIVPKGTRVALPNFAGQLGELEVLNTEQLSDLPVAGGRLTRVRWTLESLRSGELRVGPITIQLSRAPVGARASTAGTTPSESAPSQSALAQSLKTQSIQTESLPLQVRSTIEQQADPTQFRDIHPPIDVALPSARTRFAWIGFGLAAAGLVIAVAMGLLLTRRSGRIEPADWATAELTALRQALVADESSELQSTFDASDSIIREFLTLQFDGLGTSQTTDELLAGIARLPGVTTERNEHVARLLQAADAVKYAGRAITRAEMRAHLDSGLDAVEQLRPLTGTIPATHREGR